MDEIRRLLREGRSQAEVARLTGRSKSTISWHARQLDRPIDTRCARRYDWAEIQAYYDAGHSVSECQARFGFARASWSDARRRGDVVARQHPRPIELLVETSKSRSNLKY